MTPLTFPLRKILPKSRVCIYRLSWLIRMHWTFSRLDSVLLKFLLKQVTSYNFIHKLLTSEKHDENINPEGKMKTYKDTVSVRKAILPLTGNPSAVMVLFLAIITVFKVSLQIQSKIGK